MPPNRITSAAIAIGLSLSAANASLKLSRIDRNIILPPSLGWKNKKPSCGARRFETTFSASLRWY